MARTPRPAKEPGRLKQMWQVFQMTRRYDGNIVWNNLRNPNAALSVANLQQQIGSRWRNETLEHATDTFCLLLQQLLLRAVWHTQSLSLRAM